TTVIVVHRHGGLRQRSSVSKDGIGRIRVAVQHHVRERSVGACQAVVRIELDCLLKHLYSTLVVVGSVAPQVLDAAQDAFIGRELWLTPALLDQRALDPIVKPRNDGAGDLVGYGEDVRSGKV